MHAFLYIGATQQAREEAIQKWLKGQRISPVDWVKLLPSGEHIAIDDVRQFAARLILAPLSSSHTAGIINEAHLLTPEAQQALLKLLEEPPSHALLVWETANAEMLLPTIVSRCQIIRLSSGAAEPTPSGQNDMTIKKFFSDRPSDIFEAVEELGSDRSHAKAWVNDRIEALRASILSSCLTTSESPNELFKKVRLLRRLLGAQRRLMVNCQPKLTLDCVFLEH